MLEVTVQKTINDEDGAETSTFLLELNPGEEFWKHADSHFPNQFKGKRTTFKVVGERVIE